MSAWPREFFNDFDTSSVVFLMMGSHARYIESNTGAQLYRAWQLNTLHLLRHDYVQLQRCGSVDGDVAMTKDVQQALYRRRGPDQICVHLAGSCNGRTRPEWK